MASIGTPSHSIRSLINCPRVRGMNAAAATGISGGREFAYSARCVFGLASCDLADLTLMTSWTCWLISFDTANSSPTAIVTGVLRTLSRTSFESTALWRSDLRGMRFSSLSLRGSGSPMVMSSFPLSRPLSFLILLAMAGSSSYARGSCGLKACL